MIPRSLSHAHMLSQIMLMMQQLLASLHVTLQVNIHCACLEALHCTINKFVLPFLHLEAAPGNKDVYG